MRAHGSIRCLGPPCRAAKSIDELCGAVESGVPALHDGRWARATLAVCRALLDSARSGRDVALAHQVGLPKPVAGR